MLKILRAYMLELSIYHYLNKAMQPTYSLLADVAHLSIPTTKIATQKCLGLIVTALINYQNSYSKKDVYNQLVKESQALNISRYSRFNFKAIAFARDTGRPVLDNLFGSPKHWETLAAKLANKLDANKRAIKDLLQTVTALAMREVATISQDSFLNAEELKHWLSIQADFIQGDIADWMLVDAGLNHLVGLPALATESLPTANNRYFKNIALITQDRLKRQVLKPNASTGDGSKQPKRSNSSLGTRFSIATSLVLIFTILAGIYYALDYYTNRQSPQDPLEALKNSQAETVDIVVDNTSKDMIVIGIDDSSSTSTNTNITDDHIKGNLQQPSIVNTTVLPDVTAQTHQVEAPQLVDTTVKTTPTQTTENQQSVDMPEPESEDPVTITTGKEREKTAINSAQTSQKPLSNLGNNLDNNEANSDSLDTLIEEVLNHQ